MPSRLAVVLSQLGLGGAERQTLLLLRKLAGSARAPCLVLCLSEHVNPYGEEIRALGYPLAVCPRRSSFDIGRLRWLRHTFAREKIDLVHAVHLLASGYCWLARRGIRGQRLLPTVRGAVVHPIWFKRLIYRRMLRVCPTTLVNSQRGATFVTRHFGAPPERIVVVPNGIDFAALREQARGGDMRRHLGLAPDTSVLGYVGRDAPVKNVPRLIELARRLLPRHEQLHFVLVGPLLGKKDKDRLAPDLPPERVHFLGPRSDVPALLREFTALVLTSNTEGCPNVVLEALGLGTPVVSADVGDVAHMIRQGKSGFTVMSGDLSEYEGALERILADPIRFRAQTDNLAPTLETDYGLDSMVERTVEIWEHLLATRVSP